MWFWGKPTTHVYEIGIDKSVTQLESMPELDKFYITLDLPDAIRFSYDPSNYTRSQYNEYGTRLCGNKIQVYGRVYIETVLTMEGVQKMLGH